MKRGAFVIVSGFTALDENRRDLIPARLSHRTDSVHASLAAPYRERAAFEIRAQRIVRA